MHNSYYYLLMGILSISFIIESLLGYLNSIWFNKPIPQELEGVFEKGKYEKSQQYKKTNYRFGKITGLISFHVLIFMIIFGGFALVDEWANSLGSNNIVTALVFFGILMLGSDIIQTPFSVYHTFVIEQKFGFNKTTPKIFLLDKIKSWLLGAIIGGGLLSLIVYIYNKTGENFWLLVWGVMTVFMLFMSMFYSHLIVPLFNKQKPLEEGELKTAINSFCKRAGFKLANIYVIDGSKRSTKANAYFTGLGSKKRIVLYDTLIKDLSTKEIIAVLAHEIGHYKKKHTLSQIILSILSTGLMLFIFSFFVGNHELSKALGIEKTSFHLALLGFGILYSPVSMALELLTNQLSRRFEYQADRFAFEHGNGDELVSALKKLSSSSLSNLTPHPAYVFVHYSHPTLYQRVMAIKQLGEKQETHN